MIDIIDRKRCCGCTACASICSHSAISMKPDALGFYYPSVDKSKCVNCGLCDKVCQFNIAYKDYSGGYKQKAYAFRLIEDSELMKSQSGGAFFAIASQIIKEEGIVYGVGFSYDLNVQHKRVTTIEQLDELRFSKYVQSDLGLIFSMVLSDLKTDCKVLFSGTPCQVAGLKSFLPKRYHKNLITIDIICHGVPSPAIWRDYMKYVQAKYGKLIVETCFRDKKYGWNTNKQRFTLSDGKIIYGQTSNYLYFRGYSIRESCNICPFTQLRRVSDITIGDFWGWNKISSRFNDNKGISLVLVNTNMGAELMEQISHSYYLHKCRIDDCIQPQLIRPTAMHSKRNQFVEDYSTRGFLYVAMKYGDLGFNYRILQFRKFIRSIIRHESK